EAGTWTNGKVLPQFAPVTNYYVPDDVIIPGFDAQQLLTPTLKIDPGVNLEMADAETDIVLLGILDAIGTVADPILFTAETSAGWGGIDANFGSVVNLSNVTLEDGGFGDGDIGLDTPLNVNTEGINLSSVLFQDNLGSPVVIPASVNSFNLSNISFAGTGPQWIELEGGTWGNRTLPNYGASPLYYITGQDILIPGSASPVVLNIDPGVVLDMQDATIDITVQGNLNVLASTANPVRFTSQSGSWGGMNLQLGSTVQLQGVRFENGGQGGGIEGLANSLTIDSDNVTLQDVVFDGHTTSPVVITPFVQNINLSNVQFSGGGPAWIELTPGFWPSRTLPEFGPNPTYYVTGGDINLSSGSGEEGLVQTAALQQVDSLSIASGVNMEMGTDVDLFVFGVLDLQGTAAKPIRFISQTGWGGIRVEEEGQATLQNVLLDNGGQGDGQGGQAHVLSVESDSVFVTDTTFSNNTNSPIAIGPDVTAINLSNLTLSSNEVDAVTLPSGTWAFSTLPYYGGDSFYEVDGLVDIGVDGANRAAPLQNEPSVTIEPGVRIDFLSETSGIDVYEHLRAIGTASLPIVFTSRSGSWNGVVVNDTAIGEFSFAGFNNAGTATNLGYALVIDSDNVTLNNTVFANNLNPVLIGDSVTQIDISTLTFNSNGENAIVLEGGLWPSRSIPAYGALNLYQMENDVTIPVGSSVVISRGVRIDFASVYNDLIVQGELIADARPGETIVMFSSFDPSQIAQGPNQGSNANAKGVWGGIILEPGSQSTFRFVTIEEGGSGATNFDTSDPNTDGNRYVFQIESDRAILENVRFVGNQNGAVYVTTGVSTLNLNNLKFSSNTINGVLLQSGAWATRVLEDISDGIDYILEGDATIPTGTSLTVEPGVEINFVDPAYDLIVQGTLNLGGSEQRPIRLDSPDGWGSVSIEGGGSADIDFTIFKNGGTQPSAASAALVIGSSDVTVSNALFTENPRDCVIIIGGVTPTLDNNRFFGCGENGIEITPASAADLSSRALQQNGPSLIDNEFVEIGQAALFNT
ncbi:MAG: right-handed parallel beta-helix repeat-containing protein, partial [Chloroflexota bacterium]